MDDFRLRDDVSATLTDHMGDDISIVRAARVSSGTDDSWRQYSATDTLPPKDSGLINMMMRDRHGSPFEHVVFQFHIECPVFVSREFMRHRIASYNETSSRYRVLEGVFYCPPAERPLVQIGKPGAYTFERSDRAHHFREAERHHRTAAAAWAMYQESLADGTAREVARNHLGFTVFTSFYVTLNLRSLFNFLSLRWAHELNTSPTFPLWEIEQLAKQMEAEARPVAPVAFETFDRAGRRQP